MAKSNHFLRRCGLQAHILAFCGAILLLTVSPGAGQSLQFARTGISVGNGDRAILECVLIGSPKAGSQFTWSGPALMRGNSHPAIKHHRTVSTLTIDSVTSDDAGEYGCSYTAVTTISTTLTVFTSPGFLNVQEHQKFAEGTDAEILCPAFLGENPSGKMQWLRNGRFITGDRFTPSNGTLTIRNILKEDSGSDYECIIERNGSENIKKMLTVEVLPQHKLAPRIDDSKRRIEVAYGERLNLSCGLEKAQDNVLYSWTVNTDLEKDVLISSHGQLQRDVDKFLGGIYTCRAVNLYGFDVVDFSVYIQAAPLPEECSQVKTTSLGTTVVFQPCDLTFPTELSDSECDWSKRNDAGEMVNVELSERISINHNCWLTIKDIQQSDLGVYQVNISNGLGSAVHTVQLELAQATTACLSQAQVGTVPISLKITTHTGSCRNVKDELLEQHIFEEFGYSNVVLEGVTITCLSDSEKKGILRANLRGRNAGQLAAVIKERGATTVTFNNGLSLSLEVCTDDCSSTEPVPTEATGKPISNTAGVIVAVSFICVVLAGVILLVVILVRYRRRSLTKQFDTEVVLPLHTAKSSHKIRWDWDRMTNTSSLTKKPLLGRSISVSLPITSQ